MQRLLWAAPLLLLASCGKDEPRPPVDQPRLTSADVVGAVSDWGNAKRVQDQQVNETQAINCRAATYREYDALPKGLQSERKLAEMLRGCQTDVARAPATGCTVAAAKYRGGGVWQCGAVRYDESAGRVWYAASD